MKNQYLLLVAMTLLANASEPGKDKPLETQLGSNTPYITEGQKEVLKLGGMGSDAGMKAPGGLLSMMYAENALQRGSASVSSMYTNMSPSMKSAAENTLQAGVVALGSYVGYKVGRPIYNYFRPSLEDQVKKEENQKRLYELQQDRFKREKIQRKMEAVNELSKCAYSNSNSSSIDAYGIPQGCSAPTFRLVMYHEDGFDHMRGIGHRIKQLRGENGSK